ncbi:RNA-binding protein 44 [Engraulis encrasicolus]|uniref:RNA-binding protein 44 n=1 Tax=Engraulis encrasicolus TaxID=184585 RepID=UPI002FCF6A1E
MTSDLNTSRMPTFYGVSQCCCPAGCSSCALCIGPPPVVGKRHYMTGEKATAAAIQTDASGAKEWTVPVTNSRGAVGRVGGSGVGDAHGDLVIHDSFQSACDLSPTSAPVLSPGTRYAHSQRLSREGLSGPPSAAGTSSANVSALTANTSSALQASFSLDVELDRQRKIQAQGARGGVSALARPPAVHHQSDFRMATTAAAPLIDKSYIDIAQETPPEYYSFNSTAFDQTSAEWMPSKSSDHSQYAAAAEQDSASANSSLLATRGSVEEHMENSLLSTSALFPSEASMSSPGEETHFLDTTSADESLQHPEQREEFHSLMETSANPEESWPDCSSLAGNLCMSPPLCQGPIVHPRTGTRSALLQTPGKGEQPGPRPQSLTVISPENTGVQMPPEAPTPPRPETASQTIDASGDFRAHFTSVQECQASPSTTVASTEMDSPAHLDQDTQTLQASTADRSVITDIFMTDLDFVHKEFLRLKRVEEEFELFKARQMKPHPKCGCECGERWKESELKLLALQYSMCKEHCWRRYLTSAQGERDMQGLGGPGGVPEGLVESLHVLEETYSQMRRRLLSGATLEELSPLSVDTHRLNTHTLYTPAQHAECKAAASHTKPEDARSSKASTLKTQRPRSTRAGVNEEGGNVTNEAWFDAEEDLGAQAGQGTKEERLRKAMENERSGAVGDGEHRKISCQLRVTNLHQDVTEEDLLARFEKYQPKEVCITVLNKTRTGSVMLSSPDIAEAAMRDLSGSSIHGQPLQISHTTSSSSSCPPAAPPQGDHTFKRPQPPTTTTTTHGPKPSSVKVAAPYNMLPRPLSCNIEKLVNISPVPTAKGTYVPPRPPASTSSSAGSFDTLMARLSQLHPQVGRQEIVEALLELRAQHSGTLSGLPIRTIVEMASALLTTTQEVSAGAAGATATLASH